MSRLLAIDVGSIRIGIAVGDRETGIATPLSTIAGRPRAAAVAQVATLIDDEGVDEVVVGLPLELDGSEGRAVRKTRQFVEALQQIVDITVHEWDERFTSVAAERALLEADVRRGKRKEVIDQVAATMILQAFLDRARS